MRVLFLALFTLLAVFAARAGELRSPDLPAGKVTPPSPLPFVHEEHASVFASVGIVCVDCHAIGQALGTTSHVSETCHGCHRSTAPKRGPPAPPAATATP